MADIVNILAAAAGAAGAAVETDPNFNQTVLLLHGDGTDGSQNNTFLDSSSNNFTITRNPATGPNAPTQGTFSPFSQPDGRWSIFCDGNNQYLTAADSTDFEPGTGDFQINFWVYHTTAAGSLNVYIAHTTNGISLYRNTDGKFAIAQDAVAELAATTNAVPVNQWVYLTALRSSGTIKLYIDAVEEASLPSNTTNFAGSGSIGIGASSNGSNDFFGYISNLQIIKGGSTVPTSVPTSPLTTSVSSGTVSFLSCQSNRFVDNETTPVTLTANGGVKVTPFSPFAPTAAYSTSVNGGSAYLDGTGDYLDAGDNAAFELGSGNFCIQAWIYPTSTTEETIISKWTATGTAGSNSWLLFINAGALTFVTSTNGSAVDISISGGTVSANAWSHVAICRSGSDYGLFLNGTRVADTTNANSLYDTATTVKIGRYSGGFFGEFNGYISSMQLVNGSAVYDPTSTTLTIPTAPPTNITNTSLLLNFTNAGILDQTGKNNLETVGNAQIDTTTKKFGTGSMEFDGTGDWLFSPSSDLYAVGSGNFTIEFWIYLTQNFDATGQGIVTASYNTNFAVIGVNSGAGNKIDFYVANVLLSTNTNYFSLNTWTHIACVRSSGTTKIYFDGVEKASSGSLTGTGVAAPLYVGTASHATSQEMTGLIDDLRITKGVARYTSAFTPPTKAFPDL